MQPRPTNSLTSQMARRWCLRNTKKANRTEPTVGFLSSFRHTSTRERMGSQELYDRYLDIYCCGSNENRLLRCSIRIHPFAYNGYPPQAFTTLVYTRVYRCFLCTPIRCMCAANFFAHIFVLPLKLNC